MNEGKLTMKLNGNLFEIPVFDMDSYNIVIEALQLLKNEFEKEEIK